MELVTDRVIQKTYCLKLIEFRIEGKINKQNAISTFLLYHRN